ncbi:hypothetical protein DFJ73DRAFT_809988 [Zopfochytrium polystomum]|nr:hypothetical protein DFJ73DRAFT_809988 [Zopfochytrium polystomum]
MRIILLFFFLGCRGCSVAKLLLCAPTHSSTPAYLLFACLYFHFLFFPRPLSSFLPLGHSLSLKRSAFFPRLPFRQSVCVSRRFLASLPAQSSKVWQCAAGSSSVVVSTRLNLQASTKTGWRKRF